MSDPTQGSDALAVESGDVVPSRRLRVRPYPFAELGRVLRSQALAARTLLAHLPEAAGPDWPAACAAVGGAIRFRLVECFAAPVRELEAQIGGITVGIQGPGGRRALIAVDGRLAPRLSRAALGLELGDELIAPRPLSIAEEGGFQFLLGSLVGGLPWRVGSVLSMDGARSLLRTTSEEGWLLVLDAQVSTPVGHGWARLVVPDAMRLQLALPRQRVVPEHALAWLGHVSAELRVEVARTRMSAAQLADLGVGDVIVFDGTSVREPGRGPAELACGGGFFAARLDGTGLWIESHFGRRAGAFMNADKPNEKSTTDENQSSNEGRDAVLRELPVEVVAEIGRLTMTGRELVELAPGAILPIGRSLAGPVDLTVGGRVIAHGELVDVEGELGVRIVSLVK